MADAYQARQLFRRLGVGPGNTLLAGISICFVPVTYAFFKVRNRRTRLPDIYRLM